MFKILQSFGNGMLGFLLQTKTLSFIIFTLITIITGLFIPYIVKLLPGVSNLNEGLLGLPPTVWYFLNLFKIPYGLTLVVSAYATRFTIRRLPFIG